MEKDRNKTPKKTRLETKRATRKPERIAEWAHLHSAAIAPRKILRDARCVKLSKLRTSFPTERRDVDQPVNSCSDPGFLQEVRRWFFLVLKPSKRFVNLFLVSVSVFLFFPDTFFCSSLLFPVFVSFFNVRVFKKLFANVKKKSCYKKSFIFSNLFGSFKKCLRLKNVLIVKKMFLYPKNVRNF